MMKCPPKLENDARDSQKMGINMSLKTQFLKQAKLSSAEISRPAMIERSECKTNSKKVAAPALKQGDRLVVNGYSGNFVLEVA
ncbi:MAG: hypothetical protein ACI9OW_001361 [Marinobacter psychrophilus]|jgi:hypothetical protein